MAGKFLAPHLNRYFGKNFRGRKLVISKSINKINNCLIFIVVGITHNPIILVALMPR